MGPFKAIFAVLFIILGLVVIGAVSASMLCSPNATLAEGTISTFSSCGLPASYSIAAQPMSGFIKDSGTAENCSSVTYKSHKYCVDDVSKAVLDVSVCGGNFANKDVVTAPFSFTCTDQCAPDNAGSAGTWGDCNAAALFSFIDTAATTCTSLVTKKFWTQQLRSWTEGDVQTEPFDPKPVDPATTPRVCTWGACGSSTCNVAPTIATALSATVGSFTFLGSSYPSAQVGAGTVNGDGTCACNIKCVNNSQAADCIDTLDDAWTNWVKPTAPSTCPATITLKRPEGAVQCYRTATNAPVFGGQCSQSTKENKVVTRDTDYNCTDQIDTCASCGNTGTCQPLTITFPSLTSIVKTCTDPTCTCDSFLCDGGSCVTSPNSFSEEAYTFTSLVCGANSQPSLKQNVTCKSGTTTVADCKTHPAIATILAKTGKTTCTYGQTCGSVCQVSTVTTVQYDFVGPVASGYTLTPSLYTPQSNFCGCTALCSQDASGTMGTCTNGSPPFLLDQAVSSSMMDSVLNVPYLTLTRRVECYIDSEKVAATDCAVASVVATKSSVVPVSNPTCTKCGTRASNTYTFQATLNSDQLSFAFVASTDDPTCNCTSFLCLPKDGSSTTPVDCATVPTVSTVCATVGDFYNVSQCRLTLNGAALDCNNQQATTLKLSISTDPTICTVRCIKPETDLAKYTIETKVPRSEAELAAETFLCADHGTPMCSTVTYQRRCLEYDSASSTYEVFACAEPKTYDVVPDVTKCTTLCAAATASFTTGNTYDLTTLGGTGLVVCQPDSFRSQCAQQANGRKVWCALKNPTNTNANEYTLVDDANSCSPDQTTTIPATTCTVGCYKKVASLPNAATDFAAAVAATKLDLTCPLNAFRTQAADGCKDVFNTVRTKACYYLVGATPTYINDSTCGLPPVDGFPANALDDSGNWGTANDCKVICNTPSAPIDASIECTADAFKPLTSPDCAPVAKSSKRTTYVAYVDVDSPNEWVVVTSPTKSLTFDNSGSWASSCEYAFYCAAPASPTAADWKLCTANNDMCNNVCHSQYAVPEAKFQCYQTKDWAGTILSTMISSTATLCGANQPPPLDCSCQETGYCLKSSDVYPGTAPVLCSSTPSWSTTAKCGQAETRKTFLQTKGGGFLPKSSCTATNCDQLTNWPPTNGLPLNLATLCKPVSVCKPTGETTVSWDLCSANDGMTGFGDCPVAPETCNSVLQRSVECRLGADVKTAAELDTAIDAIDFGLDSSVKVDYKTSYATLCSAQTDPASPTYQCTCEAAYYCLKESNKDDFGSETPTLLDLVACGNTSSLKCPTGVDNLSCNDYNRPAGVYCRSAAGDITSGPHTTGTPCFDANKPFPKCTPDITCLAEDYCAPRNNDGTSPTITLTTPDGVAPCTTNTYSEQCFTQSGSAFTAATCTENASKTYVSARSSQCLTFFTTNDDGGGFIQTPLPPAMLNQPTCASTPPLSKPGCTQTSGCAPKPLNLFVGPTIDDTVVSGKFHDHGDFTAEWTTYGESHPTFNTIAVSFQYSVYSPSGGPKWVAIPTPTPILLKDSSATVKLPKITTSTTANVSIKIRISTANGVSIIGEPLEVYPFVTCEDVSCDKKQPGYFECFVAKDQDGKNIQNAVCQCLTTTPAVDWVDATCTETTECTALSTQCQNEGFYSFDPSTTSFCTAQCICPNGQGGINCDEGCSEAAKCNIKRGVAFPATTTTKCGCSSCFYGFAGTGCDSCIIFAGFEFATTPAITTFIGDANNKAILFTKLQAELASYLGTTIAHIAIDEKQSKLTADLVVIVIKLTGKCSASMFNVLQSDPNASDLASTWDSDVTSDDLNNSPALVESNGGQPVTVAKYQSSDPATCSTDKSCPAWVSPPECATDSTDPVCVEPKPQDTKSNKTTIIIAVVVSVGGVLLIAVIALLVYFFVIKADGAQGSSSEKQPKAKAEKAPKQKPSRASEQDVGHLELV